MFGGNDFAENEFGGSGNQNVITLAFNEIVTMTDSFLKSMVRLWSESVTMSDTMTPAWIKIFSETITVSERFKKLLNGVSTVWSKGNKTNGSWTKTNKITDIWNKIRKQ